MNLVQPRNRDYVPRRSGEIATSLLQAYALFHHNTYDAGEVCFVPSNSSFDAGAGHAGDVCQWKATV